RELLVGQAIGGQSGDVDLEPRPELEELGGAAFADEHAPAEALGEQFAGGAAQIGARTGANVDGDLKAFVKADLAWHHELASSAGNSVLLDLLQIVRSLLRVWVDRAVQDQAQASIALAEHEAVFRALEARDPDAAASAMAAHMTTASARLSGLAVGPRGDAGAA
ncbi:MAG TPA: FCD domain-containing protein, partial [Agromyces sp.]|nr:FCD domain-containing protein [Agromyces sp.]